MSIQHSSGFKKDEEDANEEAEAKLAEIKDAGNQKGDKVVEDLIYAMVNVNPEVPDKIVSKSQRFWSVEAAFIPLLFRCDYSSFCLI